jgi:hypothetical protein
MFHGAILPRKWRSKYKVVIFAQWFREQVTCAEE